MRQKLYIIHKYLALFLSLPILLLAVSGALIALAPAPSHEASPAPSLLLGELMERVAQDSPRSQILRGMTKGPGGETAHLLVKEAQATHLLWMGTRGLEGKNLRGDFFVLNKIFHESFLLGGVGKKLVAMSGVGLLLVLLSGTFFWLGPHFLRRTRALWKRRRVLASWHVMLGIVFVAPLSFQALTGSLIEFHSVFFSNRAQLAHTPPTDCDPTQVRSMLLKLEQEQKFRMVFFCRPERPYVSVSFLDGSVGEFTAEGLEVSRVSPSDWSESPLLRKVKFMKWHGAHFLGPADSTYNVWTAALVGFFVLSGGWMWFSRLKQRKGIL